MGGFDMKAINLAAIALLTLSTAAEASPAARADIEISENQTAFINAERALAAFAAAPVRAQAERLSRQSETEIFSFDEQGDLIFGDERDFRIAISDGDVFVVSRNDGGGLPGDLFVNPVSPEAPEPVDNALSTPLPAALWFLLAGLSGLGWAARRNDRL